MECCSSPHLDNYTNGKNDIGTFSCQKVGKTAVNLNVQVAHTLVDDKWRCKFSWSPRRDSSSRNDTDKGDHTGNACEDLTKVEKYKQFIFRHSFG